MDLKKSCRQERKSLPLKVHIGRGQMKKTGFAGRERGLPQRGGPFQESGKDSRDWKK